MRIVAVACQAMVLNSLFCAEICVQRDASKSAPMLPFVDEVAVLDHAGRGLDEY